MSDEAKFLERLVAAIDALGKLLADERRQHYDEVVKLRAEVAELRAELNEAKALRVDPGAIVRRVN
jgi:hypothetical protein